MDKNLTEGEGEEIEVVNERFVIETIAIRQ